MSKRQSETTSEPELSAFRNERIFPGRDDPEFGPAEDPENRRPGLSVAFYGSPLRNGTALRVLRAHISELGSNPVEVTILQ